MCEVPNNSGGTVLVALDGSPAAATAVPIARVLADQLQAHLAALYVLADNASPDLSSRALRWDAAGPDIDVRLAVGDPVTEIVRWSTDPEVVLVVMTTHGRQIEPGRTLGRVAEAVAAQATGPIVLVRPEAATDFMQHGGLIQHLLLPLDGTPTTAALLPPATDLAGRLAATIDILYVAEEQGAPPDEPGSIGAPRYVDQPQHEWPKWSDEVIERLGTGAAHCPAHVPLQVYLGWGDIGREIVRFARAHHVDIVVVARRSHLEPGRGRVLRAVLHNTPCPLLLVGAVDSG